MKIKFYTLPIPERREILDEMDKVSRNIQFLKNQEKAYLELVNTVHFALETDKTVLNNLRGRYDFD